MELDARQHRPITSMSRQAQFALTHVSIALAVERCLAQAWPINGWNSKRFRTAFRSGALTANTRLFQGRLPRRRELAVSRIVRIQSNCPVALTHGFSVSAKRATSCSGPSLFAFSPPQASLGIAASREWRSDCVARAQRRRQRIGNPGLSLQKQRRRTDRVREQRVSRWQWRWYRSATRRKPTVLPPRCFVRRTNQAPVSSVRARA